MLYDQSLNQIACFYLGIREIPHRFYCQYYTYLNFKSFHVGMAYYLLTYLTTYCSYFFIYFLKLFRLNQCF